MNFVKQVRNWLYSYVFYYDINDNLNSKEKEFKVLINQYSFVLFIIFFLITLFNLIVFNFGPDVILIGIFTLFFGFSPFLLRKYRTNKNIIAVLITILTLIINYYSNYCGLYSGIFLYFLPLVISVTIIFGWKEDFKYLKILIPFIILNMYLTIIFDDYNFFRKSSLLINDKKTLQLVNITCILIIKFLIYLIIVDKSESVYILENRNILKKEEISNLKNEVHRLNTLLNKNDISEEYLKELIDCIQLSDTVFIEKYEFLYPGFFDRLRNISKAPLNISELKYCALFKLGYTTKQIAIYTDTTIKSVESKKYRIRKKLNLTSYDSPNGWFENL